MLRREFQGLPSELKILANEYILINDAIPRSEINKDAWGRSIFPGLKLKMPVVMEALQAETRLACLRGGCSRIASHFSEASIAQCPIYGLAFIPEEFNKSRQGAHTNSTITPLPLVQKLCPQQQLHGLREEPERQLRRSLQY